MASKYNFFRKAGLQLLRKVLAFTTSEVAEEYCDLAISIAHDMNLNLCGIDILAPTIKKWCENYIILEINSAPGLDNYAFTGDKQKEYVDSLYLQILKYVEDSFTG